ncbi:MAG: hypothetical protein C0512_15435 [Flavobacterium sp.]|nr:hypothetical protein [Flavobacterium sp.]
MMKAIYNGEIIAESNETIVIEGNHYFPPGSLKKDFFRKSTTHSTCPWKGAASYNTIEVNGTTNKDAAWFYPNPSDKAKEIKDYVAFWKGIEITE